MKRNNLIKIKYNLIKLKKKTKDYKSLSYWEMWRVCETIAYWRSKLGYKKQKLPRFTNLKLNVTLPPYKEADLKQSLNDWCNRIVGDKPKGNLTHIIGDDYFLKNINYGLR